MASLQAWLLHYTFSILSGSHVEVQQFSSSFRNLFGECVQDLVKVHSVNDVVHYIILIQFIINAKHAILHVVTVGTATESIYMY